MSKIPFSSRAISLCCMLCSGLWLPVTSGAQDRLNLPTSQAQEVEQYRSLNQITPRGVGLVYGSILETLYRSHNFQPMWQDSRATAAFERQLAEVALSGVQPQFERWLGLLDHKEISGMSRDLILSDALLGYLQFVAEAPVKGESWFYSSGGYSLAAPSNAMIRRWQQAVTNGSLDDFMLSLEPQHPQYRAMQQRLSQLINGSLEWPTLRLNRTLRPGDRDSSVPVLREILARGGWIKADQTPVPQPQAEQVATDTAPQSASSGFLPATGADSAQGAPDDKTYSSDLVAAVEGFQRWQGLAADGVIGPGTRNWLATSPRQRAVLLALNIQRLRLLPDDMQNGIMVNIPAYSLNYYANGKTILSSKVIVGRPDRKTPLMRSALNSVVLNPPWNIPDSMLRNDLLPKVKRDPSYLEKHDYVVLSGWGAEAQVLDPRSIDWQSVSAQHFPYRIRQSAGPQSALGRFKFNMPSSEAIYLHDTPNHGLFQREMRSLSSGCVRVNKAADLALLLLKNVGWDGQRVSNTVKQTQTRVVSIQHRIPVNLYYLTAWVSDQGQTQYRTDIYNYDKLANRGLSAVTVARDFLK